MRIASAVGIVVAVGAAGAAMARTKTLEPAWDVLAIQRTSALRGPGGWIRAQLASELDGDVRVVSLAVSQPDEEALTHVTRFAVSRAGMWIESHGPWYQGRTQGAPLIAADRGTFFDRVTGLSLSVDADGTTCAQWTDPDPACDGDCYWVVCWAKDEGVVRLGGALAPNGHEFVGPRKGCVGPDLAPELVSFGGDADRIELCTHDYPWDRRTPDSTCRVLDRATGQWAWSAPRQGEDPLLPIEPPTVIEDDGAVRICRVGQDDCSAFDLPAGVQFHHAAASDNGRLGAAVFFEGDGTGVIATFDVRNNQEHAREPLGEGMTTARLSYAADALIVERPDYTEIRDGKRLTLRGVVGGKSPIVTDTPPAPFAGKTWLFASLSEVVFQNIRTGKVERRTELPDPPQTRSTRAWVRRVGRDVAVVYSPLLDADDRGGVVVVDRTGRVVTAARPGRCP